MEAELRNAVLFLKSVTVVERKLDERNQAHKDLHKHIDKITTVNKSKRKGAVTTHTNQLKKKIEAYVQSEKALAGHKSASHEGTDQLNAQINELESRIEDEQTKYAALQKKYAELENKYKEQGKEMKETFAYLKEKLTEFISEKRQREERLHSIHDRLAKKIKHPSP